MLHWHCAARCRWSAAVVIAMGLLALAGCGPRLYSVRGKVVWENGAEAHELAGGTVVCESEDGKVAARGEIQENGSFELSTQPPARPGPRRGRRPPTGRAASGAPRGGRIIADPPSGSAAVQPALGPLRRTAAGRCPGAGGLAGVSGRWWRARVAVGGSKSATGTATACASGTSAWSVVASTSRRPMRAPSN